MWLLWIAVGIVLYALRQEVQSLRRRVDELEADRFSAYLAHRDDSHFAVQPASSEAVDEPHRAETLRAEQRLAEIVGEPSEHEVVPDEQAALLDEAPVEEQSHPARSFFEGGFEELFGRRLPIWAGGITLAVAGFLIVKFSIDAGLLSPTVRVILGLLFGVALIAGAEAAKRAEQWVADPRVQQALAGAGIATLYAVILAASNLYHLIGTGLAFGGMTAITALAGGLSIRFGAPSAVLGLIGGLATPALIGSAEPNVPLLTVYLALAAGGLTILGARQRWWWLGMSAIVGGFGWGFLLLLGGALDTVSQVSLGIYALAFAVGLPLLLIGDRAAVARLAASAAGCAQMAALVAIGDFAPLTWALYGLLSVAVVWLARREPAFERIPPLGLAVAILLAFAWPSPTATQLGLVLAGMAAIYGALPAWRLARGGGGWIDAAMVAAVGLAIGVVPQAQLSVDGWPLAIPPLVGALLTGLVASRLWRSATGSSDDRFLILSVATAVLVTLAALVGLEDWAVAPVVALVVLALHFLSAGTRDHGLRIASWAFAAFTMLLLLVDPPQLLAALGEPDGVDGLALIRWLVPAIVAALIARWSPDCIGGAVAQAVAVLLAYTALAQVAPPTWLPLIAVVALAMLASRAALLPAASTAGGIALVCAIWPVVIWCSSGIMALAGSPFLVTGTPPLFDVLTRIAPLALILAASAWLARWPEAIRKGAGALAAVLGFIAMHSLFKQLFMIDDPLSFAAIGQAERTAFELLLAAGALLAWRLNTRIAAIGFAAAALFHFGWFSLLLHNPLWTQQWPGPYMLAGFALAIGLLVVGECALPALSRWRDWAVMVLIPVAAFTALRQLAHDPVILSSGVGQGEDIARSALAIALAVGFLRYGIMKNLRDWRIASLVLMLAAVAKVFLFDASGLDGLLRIASFAALGFSLIGLGWVYNRYLPDPRRV